MAAILSAVGDIFAAAIGWVGDVAELITKQTVVGTFDNPIIIIFIVLPLVGLGVGLFRRLINVN